MKDWFKKWAIVGGVILVIVILFITIYFYKIKANTSQVTISKNNVITVSNDNEYNWPMICTWITISDEEKEKIKDIYQNKHDMNIPYQQVYFNLKYLIPVGINIYNMSFYTNAWSGNVSLGLTYNNIGQGAIFPPRKTFWITSNTWSGSEVPYNTYIYSWDEWDITFDWWTKEWGKVEWWTLVLKWSVPVYRKWMWRNVSCLFVIPLDFTNVKTNPIPEEKIIEDFNNSNIK